MSKWVSVVSVSIVFVAMACGSSGPPPTPTPAPTATPGLPPGSVLHTVEVKNFLHESLTIKAGESILWTNREANNVLHSVVHTTLERGEVERFSSPNMQADEAFRFTFTEPGEYRYVCRIHPIKMKAIITVVAE